MPKSYELSPAYGRDYKNAKEAKEAFLAGKDWEGDYQLNFQICGKSDFQPGDTVLLRYKRLTQVASLKVPAKVPVTQG